MTHKLFTSVVLLLLLISPFAIAQDSTKRADWHESLTAAIADIPSLERVRAIRPSGDIAGATDLQNIQAALDDPSVKMVALDGFYVVNAPLRVDAKTLRGVTRSKITYAGPPTTDYLVKVVGGFDTGSVSGLILSCKYLCRGLQVLHSAGIEIIDGVRVEESVGIGCDLVDCWGSSTNGLSVSSARGICIRTHRCNSFLFLNTRITSSHCFRNTKQAENQSTWDYAYQNGQDAARKDVVGYAEDWPATDDKTVINLDGPTSYVQTPEEDRACLVLTTTKDTQDLTTFINLLFEGNRCGHYPAITVKSGTTKFANVRFEDCDHAGAVVALRGAQFDLMQAGLVSFETVAFWPKRPAREFIRAYTASQHIDIRQIITWNALKNNLVVYDGGKHVGLNVSGWITDLPFEDAKTALENGATFIDQQYR